MATKSKTIAADTKATVTPAEAKAVAAEATKETKATAKKSTESKAADAKAEAKTTAAKKTATKATTAKKTTTAKNTTTKKAAEPAVSYVLQYGGKEVVTSNILETVKKIWVEKFQGKLEEIKTIDIYMKPEENRAYFVVNGLSNGDYFVEL